MIHFTVSLITPLFHYVSESSYQKLVSPFHHCSTLPRFHNIYATLNNSDQLVSYIFDVLDETLFHWKSNSS